MIALRTDALWQVEALQKMIKDYAREADPGGKLSITSRWIKIDRDDEHWIKIVTRCYRLPLVVWSFHCKQRLGTSLS